MDGQVSDYLVIGAGSSGCTIAARLSENRDNRVTLIEAGGSDFNPFLFVPGLGFAASSIAEYNWNFVTEPIAALHDRRMTFLEGKVIGGSSSINGMIYTRGHPSEYDAWRDLGCTGWGYDEILPFFRKTEANARGADQWHGALGPMPLRRANPRLPICEAFLDAAAGAGFPIVDDLNRDQPEGLGWYDVNVDRGLRMSAARSFLKPARGRPNLTVVANTQALRLIISNGRATGLVALRQGREVTFSAKREVIVCCGAIKSPQLLMLSGIGAPDDLRKFNIEVVAESPNVGQNLQNHPCYRPRFTCTAPVTAYRHAKPLGMVRAGLKYVFSRSGPLAESFASAGGFFKSDPDLPLADMQVVLLSALPHNNRKGKNFLGLLPREEGFGLTVYQGTPYSRGQITLNSEDPLQPPRVDAGYFSDPRDIEILASGVQRTRDIMRRPEIAGYIAAEIAPGDKVQSRADLIEEIRRESGTSYHMSGTCAMGADEDSVLDTRLRVRGVERLRVADTSVIPRLPNAALHAVALMLGEKAAAMVLEDAA